MDNISGVVKPPETSMELELLVEDELCRLQRQYRIMESDRMAYVDHVKANMGKQNLIINKLKREHNALIMNLRVADSKNNRRKDEQVIVQLKRLLDDHYAVVEKIKTRRTYLNEIDYQIRKVQKQIVGLRKILNTFESSRCERLALAQGNLLKLENKLETCHNRFGAVLAQNTRLRETIDHLLIERQNFNKHWEGLFGRLGAMKKYMIDLIEQATLCYDQRDEWCKKLEALRLRAYSDLQCHAEEMHELQRNLDHDVKLQSFLQIKGQRRIAETMLRKELMKREQAKIALREQTFKYSKTLQDIQEFAGISNVDQLASQFLKQEEENFALFNYIHELNYELETLADSIVAIRIKIDEQRLIHAQHTAKQIENIDFIKNYLGQVTAATGAAAAECSDLNRQLRKIFDGIGRLFQKVNCDKAPILELLGQMVKADPRAGQWEPNGAAAAAAFEDKPEVVVGAEGKKYIMMNVHNVCLYLGVLEDKINESLRSICYSQGRKPMKQPVCVLEAAEPMPKLKVENIQTPCPICFEAELMSRSDTITVVMTHKAVRKRIRNLSDSNSRFMHHVSNCDLPQAAAILRKRFNP